MNTIPPELLEISQRLKAQDNRCTAEPLFCLQMLCRDVAYDPGWVDNHCWHNMGTMETVYDDDPDFKEPEGEGWQEHGYVDRWETVMVAFTEQGLKDYMVLDGHNVERRAFRGKTRIYIETFRRCDEMIAIRKYLMSL
jgi:hypothetical protein